ncbi:hypothetical protein P7K49_014887 [Saguinus oedipus]|uniref:Uncharacterized protein n=1 Tax=Saguinus oedipus TaxID=9490 RepID=A0ABQ9V7N2_SAGOE|nr:hypothetical protein P7K49_014887 [Saguinus oedipus]
MVAPWLLQPRESHLRRSDLPELLLAVVRSHLYPYLQCGCTADAGSQQIGFLLGSCGVTVALTSDACHKGLPKSPTGEIPQFKGRPPSL